MASDSIQPGENKSRLNNKSISVLRNSFQTLFKLLKLFLDSPIRSLKLISINNTKILLNAIKNEPPHQISKNFKRLIEGEASQITCKKNTFKAYTKANYLKEKNDELEQFIASKKELDFTEQHPVVSIVLVFYNQAALSLSCLSSIKENTKIPFQLIIIDNDSNDETPAILEKIKGANIIRNKNNFHFIHACNQAISYLNTDYILFLNNDVELFDNSIGIAYEQLASNKDYGAIGGMVILPDGNLQEAGSIIWNDGSCLGYGRGQSPQLHQFNFKRFVDYCSAAFLMTRTELFKKHNGFDPIFKPAYYEETDYCLWLQEQGYKVVYHPQIVVRHFEFASGSQENANSIIEKNHQLFYKKHKTRLSHHHSFEEYNISVARFATSQQSRKKILYVDAKIPHRDYGAGFPRSNAILQIMSNLGYQITLYPLNHSSDQSWKETYRDIEDSIEVVWSRGFEGFKVHFLSLIDDYDFLWISRAHDLDAFKKVLTGCGFKGKIIYDCEAIYAEREINRLKLHGESLSQNQVQSMMDEELKLTKFADKIVTVNNNDALKFSSRGIKNVSILGHFLKMQPIILPFDERMDLLFVGNLDHDDSPNVDSILWFSKEVWPILKSKLPELKFHVIGSANAQQISQLKIDDIHFHGRVEKIASFYRTCRVFVAPTRFAAGIPYKIHEAASHNLPVVATQLLGKQLEWKHKEEILLSELEANDFAEACFQLYTSHLLWERIQKNAASKIVNENSGKKYIETISKILK